MKKICDLSMPVMDLDEFKKSSEGEKLNLLMIAINSIGMSVNKKFSQLQEVFIEDE